MWTGLRIHYPIIAGRKREKRGGRVEKNGGGKIGRRGNEENSVRAAPKKGGGESWVELKWLFNVTINDISVIYVTAHGCAGGLKKKLDLRSGSQRHRHFVGFFNVPVLAPTRDHPFYTVIPTHRPILGVGDTSLQCVSF